MFDKSDHEPVNVQTQQEWLARDGSKRAIVWSTSVLKRPDGTIERLLATGIDVTELRHAEERCNTSAIHLRMLFVSTSRIRTRIGS